MDLSSSLQGLKILDLSRLIPGPFGTKFLSDLGASVIKIEEPRQGDYISAFGPAFFDHSSVLEVFLNQNKKRMVIDYFSKEGAILIKELVKTADVFIESHRDGVLSAVGLGPDELFECNPELVYCSVVGHSSQSKQARHGSHDLNFMAASGILPAFLSQSSLRLPQYPLADFVGGGMFLAVFVLAALVNRGGTRRYVEVPVTEAMTYLSQALHVVPEEQLDPLLSGLSARYNLYPTKDKKLVAVAAIEDKFWKPLCEALNLPSLIDLHDDVEENERAKEMLSQAFLSETAAYWLEFSKKHDVCVSVVAGKEELLTDGLLKNCAIKSSHGVKSMAQAAFLKQDEHASFARRGEDTIAVLRELGCESSQIQQWLKDGVIGGVKGFES